MSSFYLSSIFIKHVLMSIYNDLFIFIKGFVINGVTHFYPAGIIPKRKNKKSPTTYLR